MTEPHDLPADRDLLQRYLAERDAPCPVCAYNLRGLDSDVCPECGAEIDLRIGSDNLKLGPWLAAILSVGLPFGFMVLFIVFLVGIIFTHGGDDELSLVIGMLLVGSVLYGMALTVLMNCRRRFWKLARSRQQLYSAIICGLAWLGAAITLASTLAIFS